mmetsp:Transcript_14083/g.20582  ORF Transcript_14083/g.20582 Transcript_14083/m.20582 type:complete len:281 (-) Transcript_14083:363-1205(-)
MLDFLTPVAVQSGLICIAVQSLFYVLCAYVLPKGPWTEMPGFTAHQIVAFPLMVYLAYNGVMAWVFSGGDDSDTDMYNTPYDRMLKLHPIGIKLSEIVVGMQLIWDTPLCLITPALFEPLMVAHHIGMFLTAAQLAGSFSRSVGSYHALFYLGVIEISSIPLVFVDVFHPKHKPWFEYLKKKGPSSLLHSLNEACRVAFALSFIVVRGILFPYEVFTSCVPDIFYTISLPEEERDGATLLSLYTVLTTSVSFTFLQMYWATLVARQIMKALAGKEGKKED